jgi:hypothetical protein
VWDGGDGWRGRERPGRAAATGTPRPAWPPLVAVLVLVAVAVVVVAVVVA